MKGRARLLPLVAALASCTPPPGEDCLDARGTPLGPVTAVLTGDGVRVRGFDDDVDTPVAIRFDGTSTEAPADENGRFDVVVTGGAQTLEVNGTPVPVRTADIGACVPGDAPIEAGTVPNGLSLALCEGALHTVVAASGDGALHITRVSDRSTATVAFPVDTAGRGANPWHVATRANLAVTSLFGQHRVALVDLCAGRELAVGRATDEDGIPVLVDVTPALGLTQPLDADGDGETETSITRMELRHPEGVALVGDVVLATFSNLLEPGARAQFGPGVLFRWQLVGESLVPLGATVLPFQNPQSITLDAVGRPWISASGVLDQRDGRFAAATDGGLLRVDADTGAVEQQLFLGRFAPGTPAFTTDHAVVGSLTHPTVRVLALDGSASFADLALGPDRVESVFAVAALPGGLVVAVEFGTDSLHVIDPRGPTLHPWPFTSPISLSAGDFPRGAQGIAVAPLSGSTEAAAPDAFALLGLSSELVPLRFWQGVGP